MKKSSISDFNRATNNEAVDAFFKNLTVSSEPVSNYSVLNYRYQSEARPKPNPMRKNIGTEYVQRYSKELNTDLSKTFSSQLDITGFSAETSVDQLTLFNETIVESKENVVDRTKSETGQKFHAHRVNLPIHEYKREIVIKSRSHPVIMIQGDTGSGKSTQVPQYIYDDYASRKVPCNILISQPRRIAAITVAQRVSQERDVRIGSLVGYQVGLNKKVNAVDNDDDDITQITFCTTGVILQKLIKEKSMAKYSHIILDEVHERDVEIDFLIIVIRRLLSTNSPDTKIILMSATLETAKFQDFFKIPIKEIDSMQHEYEYLFPPIIDVYGAKRKFEIKERYLEDVQIMRDLSDTIDFREPGISQSMYNRAAKLIGLLLIRSKKTYSKVGIASILVFLPGIHEIECFHDELDSKEIKSELQAFNPEIHILHSSLSTEEQRKAFVQTDRPKIILSTNIAESSVTIPNVFFVVDFCLTKALISKHASQMSSLELQWTSKNNSKQRAGRCGRVAPGTVYRLVGKEFYNKKMLEYAIPEIRLIPLESVVIKIKKFEMGTPLEILAVSLDSPDESKIVDAILVLKEHGGLYRFNKYNKFEYDDGELTFLGDIMSALPCDIRISKLIVLGYLFSVLDESIIIGAGLNIRGIFSQSIREKMTAYTYKVRWSKGSGSDCIAIYHAYTTWINYHNHNYFLSRDEEQNWCIRHGLDLKNLNEMRLLIQEIYKRLRHFNIQNLPESQQLRWQPSEKILILKVVLAGAFGPSNFFFTDNKCANKDREAIKVINEMDLNRTIYFRNMDRSLIADIYKSQLKNILVKKGVCSEISKVSIKFDYQSSERVYVTFEDYHSLVEGDSKFYFGKVVPEVYKAVKLRQLERNVFLNVMNHEQTQSYAIEHGLGTINGVKFEHVSHFIKDPEFYPLPTSTTETMSGIVTHVDHCGKFYFRPSIGYFSILKYEDNRYENLFNEIQNHLRICEYVAADDKLKDGCDVVFKSGDMNQFNKHERAKFIQYLGMQRAKIHLVDRGCNVEVTLDKIMCYKLPSDSDKIRKYCPRIFECTLTEVQPSYFKSYDGKWTLEATKKFRDGVVNKRAKIEIFSVVENIVTATLYTIDQGEKFINWNQKLIDDGYAEEAEESYASKMNHQKRDYIRYRTNEPSKPEVEFKNMIDKSLIGKNIRHPPMDKCNERITLIGPTSPLESLLRGISTIFNTNIKVDAQSVNSVLLDDEYANSQDKFFVAVDVTCNSRNEHVSVRETTSMPNLPGLNVILSLIFAPYVEIRRNKDSYQYDSIMTGLGYDQNENRPYFHERDTFQMINIDLTPQDLREINYLRNEMSHMLFIDPFEKRPELFDSDRFIYLSSIKKHITSILNRKYTICSTKAESSIFEWETDQQDAIKLTNSLGYRSIFDYIAVSTLKPMSDEARKKMIKYAKNLENATSQNSSFIEECKLCNKALENANDLKIHLMSKLHNNRLKQLGA